MAIQYNIKLNTIQMLSLVCNKNTSYRLVEIQNRETATVHLLIFHPNINMGTSDYASLEKKLLNTLKDCLM